MKFYNSSRFKSGLCALAVVVMTGAVSGCATTVVKSEAVPISYKVGTGDAQYASIQTPNRIEPRHQSLTQRSAPSISEPMPYRTSPSPAPKTVAFDQSRIDTQLYKHQKLGKTYSIAGRTYSPQHDPDYDVVGTASWYGDKFHGKPTATGEIYDKNDMTAAHKTLPLNSMAFVTNLENGKSLLVRLNDRGPFIGDRIIDLSEAAARELGTIQHGLGRVRVQYAGPADPMLARNMFNPRNKPISRSAELPVMPEQAKPTYKPLREFSPSTPGQSYPPAANRPVAEAAPQIPYSAPQTPVQKPTAPFVPQVIPEDGGQVTLTIKGPIHMAGSKDSDPEAKYIPAIYRSEQENGN